MGETCNFKKFFLMNLKFLNRLHPIGKRKNILKCIHQQYLFRFNLSISFKLAFFRVTTPLSGGLPFPLLPRLVLLEDNFPILLVTEGRLPPILSSGSWSASDAVWLHCSHHKLAPTAIVFSQRNIWSIQ